MHSKHTRVPEELEDINSPEKFTERSIQGRIISCVEREETQS